MFVYASKYIAVKLHSKHNILVRTRAEIHTLLFYCGSKINLIFYLHLRFNFKLDAPTATCSRGAVQSCRRSTCLRTVQNAHQT